MIPRRGPVCAAATRRPVRLHDEPACGIDPQREAVAPEPVHRNGDADVLQERAQVRGVTGVVPTGREMDPEPCWLDDGVVGRTRLLRRPPGDLCGAPILRSAMERHEPDPGAQDQLLFDARKGEELSQIHTLRLALARAEALCNPVIS